jgi:hypothetical protein
MFIILGDAHHGKLLKSQLRYLGLLNSHHSVGNCLLFYHALLESLVSHKKGNLFRFKQGVQLFYRDQQELKSIVLMRHKVEPHRGETIKFGQVHICRNRRLALDSLMCELSNLRDLVLSERILSFWVFY